MRVGREDVLLVRDCVLDRLEKKLYLSLPSVVYNNPLLNPNPVVLKHTKEWQSLFRGRSSPERCSKTLSELTCLEERSSKTEIMRSTWKKWKEAGFTYRIHHSPTSRLLCFGSEPPHGCPRRRPAPLDCWGKSPAAWVLALPGQKPCPPPCSHSSLIQRHRADPHLQKERKPITERTWCPVRKLGRAGMRTTLANGVTQDMIISEVRKLAHTNKQSCCR